MTTLRIAVACASPACEIERKFTLPATATLADALAAAGEDAGLAKEIAQASAFGVWGKVRPLSHVLRDGDRVEIYRPLLADPKEARRTRARR